MAEFRNGNPLPRMVSFPIRGGDGGGDTRGVKVPPVHQLGRGDKHPRTGATCLGIQQGVAIWSRPLEPVGGERRAA